MLSFASVGVRFGPDAAPAVDNVSLEVNRGEIFGIVGESGSGKSTLANAFMGLLPENAWVTGGIRFDGREFVGLTDEDLRQIRGDQVAMIFQDPPPASTRHGPWATRSPRPSAPTAPSARLRQARAVALDDGCRHPRPGDPLPRRAAPLSGGMRQRIVIAAALANNPQLLIADEPTTALDVTIQAQVLQLIEASRRDHGTTVVLITHDLGVVGQVCDRVGVMRGGRLLEVAATRDLFKRPTHPYTRALLAANPAGTPRGTRLPVIPAEWSVESPQNSEAARIRSADAPREISVTDLLRVEGSGQDLFPGWPAVGIGVESGRSTACRSRCSAEKPSVWWAKAAAARVRSAAAFSGLRDRTPAMSPLTASRWRG